MNTFIEGLNPTHRTLVSKYRQDNSNVPFLRWANYAKAQGAAVCARDTRPKKITLQEPNNSSRTKTLHPNWRPRGSANIAQSLSDSENASAYLVEGGDNAEPFVLGQTDSYSQEYTTTAEDPSRTYLIASCDRNKVTGSSSAVLSVRSRSFCHTLGTKPHMDDRTTCNASPGWAGRPPIQGENLSYNPPSGSTRQHALICYLCYERGIRPFIVSFHLRIGAILSRTPRL